MEGKTTTKQKMKCTYCVSGKKEKWFEDIMWRENGNFCRTYKRYQSVNSSYPINHKQKSIYLSIYVYTHIYMGKSPYLDTSW